MTHMPTDAASIRDRVRFDRLALGRFIFGAASKVAEAADEVPIRLYAISSAHAIHFKQFK